MTKEGFAQCTLDLLHGAASRDGASRQITAHLKSRRKTANRISWDSGSRVQALDDNNGVPISFSAVTRVGLEAFVELDKSPDPANPKSLRLKLAVDNLFNYRLRVAGYTGLNDASQRLLTDPYGRIIRITLRKSL